MISNEGYNVNEKPGLTQEQEKERACFIKDRAIALLETGVSVAIATERAAELTKALERVGGAPWLFPSGPGEQEGNALLGRRFAAKLEGLELNTKCPVT